MTYKKNIICLLIMIAVLVSAYAGSFIFSYDRDNEKSASHLWLDPNTAGRVNRLVINTGWDELEFLKKNNQWFIKHFNNEYPARSARMEDFISVFTTRASWPVRSSSSSAHERFGLNNGASRITFYNDYSALLDLLMGNDDVMGYEAYFRKAGQNEVRSGDSSIRSYLTGNVTSWYNLRLIPESEGGNVTINNIQRLTVINGEETQVFSRSNRRWEIISGGSVSNPDVSKIEEYVNFVLNAEGEDFIDPAAASGMSFDHIRLILEFGNGNIIFIYISESDESNKRYASLSSSNYFYQLPLWVSLRLLRDAQSFESD